MEKGDCGDCPGFRKACGQEIKEGKVVTLIELQNSKHEPGHLYATLLVDGQIVYNVFEEDEVYKFFEVMT
jgi:hypothetical protein